MTFDAQNVEILSKHITIVHHIKGRVRFKIDPKIQNYADKINLEALAELDKKARGIKSVSLNKLAKSLTIEYDNTVIADSLWDELVGAKEYQSAANILNGLVKEG